MGHVVTLESLCLIAFMNGLVAYLFGHQGSFVVAGLDPRAPRRFTMAGGPVPRLNLRLAAMRTNSPPLLFGLVWFYHWFWFAPWVFLVWFGYETVWWRAVVALILGFLFRLVLTAVEKANGLQEHAWAIAIFAVPAIPFVLWAMIAMTLGRL